VVQIDGAARFGERALRLRIEEVGLEGILAGLVAELRSRAVDRRLSVQWNGEAGGGALAADARWVRQAVWNLLTNAVRFTPDGGSIQVESLAGADDVGIAVSDTGIGIAASELESIFEPFSAATGDPLLHGSGLFTFGARGLGLGLALVRRVAEAHRGRVEVASAVGLGSRFVLWLPRAGNTSGNRLLAEASPNR